MKIRPIILMTLVVWGCLHQLLVCADENTEKNNLANLIKDLEFYGPYIDKISRDASIYPPHVDYEEIKKDFKKIQDGLAERLKEKLTVPRVIEPLNGNYKKECK